MKYIVKWVEMDEIFNYYPCVKIFVDYNEAKNFYVDKDEELNNQETKLEDLFEGKIISEIYLEEVEI